MNYVVSTFYKFAPLQNHEALKEPLLREMKRSDIKGTIILAAEGLNGTVCGTAPAIDCLTAYLKNHPALSKTIFQTSFSDFNPFDKAKVKLRKEIVTLGVDNIDPLAATGAHLTPKEWNELLSDPDVLVIDTRNDYEVKLGTFKGAVNPQTDNFRDFPAFVTKELSSNKNKKIAMYCTGGIRCEKSTALLKKEGFSQVYQLHGGILNYLNSIPEEESLWEGSCFVFDNRVAVDKNLQGLAKGSIDLEWKNNNKKRNTADSSDS